MVQWLWAEGISDSFHAHDRVDWELQPYRNIHGSLPNAAMQCNRTINIAPYVKYYVVRSV